MTASLFLEVNDLKKKITAILLLLTVMLNSTACKETILNRYDAQFLEVFDTVTQVVGYAKDKEQFTKYANLIHDNLLEYHELYDIYHDYDGINNIKTINDNAGIAPVKVDQRIIDLLKFSKDEYKKTGGKINVAFGAVLAVWHQYREAGIDDPENAKLPPMDVLKEKAAHVDIEQMVIDEQASTVYLKDPEMSLDVGAIAKGYATEQVSQIAIKAGFTKGMISVGGNVRTFGTKGNTTDQWNVGIQNPDMESQDKYLYVLKLQDMSLVTSGDYQRYYTVDGKTYHHIIDSDTLMPTSYFRAVTIVCQDSGLADALSTSVFNMPYEEGLAYIESLDNTEALWVMKDGTMKYSSGFEAYIKK